MRGTIVGIVLAGGILLAGCGESTESHLRADGLLAPPVEPPSRPLPLSTGEGLVVVGIDERPSLDGTIAKRRFDGTWQHLPSVPNLVQPGLGAIAERVVAVGLVDGDAVSLVLAPDREDWSSALSIDLAIEEDFFTPIWLGSDDISAYFWVQDRVVRISEAGEAVVSGPISASEVCLSERMVAAIAIDSAAEWQGTQAPLSVLSISVIDSSFEGGGLWTHVPALDPALLGSPDDVATPTCVATGPALVEPGRQRLFALNGGASQWNTYSLGGDMPPVLYLSQREGRHVYVDPRGPEGTAIVQLELNDSEMTATWTRLAHVAFPAGVRDVVAFDDQLAIVETDVRNGSAELALRPLEGTR